MICSYKLSLSLREIIISKIESFKCGKMSVDWKRQGILLTVF